jgi:hypothetical protein
MSDIPDSVSPSQLLERIRNLRKEGGLPPRSTTLPTLPVSDPSCGLLDLTVVIEQIVLDGGGVIMPQLLHLVSFLLDAVVHGIKTTVEPHTKINNPLDLAIATRADADIRMLLASQELVYTVLKPMTASFTGERLQSIKDLGHDGKQALRRLLVSDAMLGALGISEAEFEKHFYARFSDELG